MHLNAGEGAGTSRGGTRLKTSEGGTPELPVYRMMYTNKTPAHLADDLEACRHL